MGGYGSGMHNRSWRPTVEGSRRLSAHALRHAHLFRAGELADAILGGVALTVDLRDDRNPHLTIADVGARVTLPLRATPQPFGNVRWWLVCPRCRMKRNYLYDVRGLWRCRTCHGLVYGFQRPDKPARLQLSADRLLRRLGASPGERAVGKPWKMRRTTFARIMDRVDGLDRRVIELRMERA